MDSPLEQKVKAKAQQAKGEAYEYLGQGVKGGIAKAQGKINEKIADLRNNGAHEWDDDWV